jgi:hypothetical protein
MQEKHGEDLDETFHIFGTEEEKAQCLTELKYLIKQSMIDLQICKKALEEEYMPEVHCGKYLFFAQVLIELLVQVLNYGPKYVPFGPHI